MQDPDRRDDINVQAPRFLLASTLEPCPRCGAITPLYALALPPGHRVLEPDDEAQGEASAETWRIAPHVALLFHVEFVTRAVRRRLQSLADSYRPSEAEGEGEGEGGGGGSAEERWANHCARCGATIDDEELFGEPDVAFQPATAEGAARIHLVAVDCPFAAVAAGYVHDPAHFEATA